MSGTDVAPERPPVRDLRPPSTGRDVAVGLALAALVVVQLVVDPPRAVFAGFVTALLAVAPLTVRSRAPSRACWA